jgi:hypothetical protein
MIIDLSKSKLFTVHPDDRFAREYQVPKGVWTELWKRYKLMGYDVPELCEYFLIKTKIRASHRNINRWIVRTELYNIGSPVLKMGATKVNSEIFGFFEEIVLYEFTKHLRFSGTKNSKAII